MTDERQPSPDPKRQHKDLLDAGYAPGNYMFRCIDCSGESIGDKRARRCRECAEKRVVSKVDQQPQCSHGNDPDMCAACDGVRSPSSNLRGIYSDLIELGAELARGEGVPDWSEHRFYVSTPAAERREIMKALRDADEAMRAYAWRVKAIADKISQEMLAKRSGDETGVPHADSVRLDWLEAKTGRFANIDRITSVNGKFNGYPTLREAIDHADTLQSPVETPTKGHSIDAIRALGEVNKDHTGDVAIGYAAAIDDVLEILRGSPEETLASCTCGSTTAIHEFTCAFRRDGDDGKGAVKASEHAACIWRDGCKHPEVCNANLRCVPGGIEGKSP